MGLNLSDHCACIFPNSRPCWAMWCIRWTCLCQTHYSDIIISMMACQVTSFSTVCTGADERKHQNSASLAFVRGIHQWLLDSPYKGPVTWKMFPFDDVVVVFLVVLMLRLEYYEKSLATTISAQVFIRQQANCQQSWYWKCVKWTGLCLQCGQLLITLAISELGMTENTNIWFKWLNWASLPVPRYYGLHEKENKFTSVAIYKLSYITVCLCSVGKTVGIQINSSLPGRNGRHFTDNIFKFISSNEKALISNKISLKLALSGQINNIPTLV